MGVADKASVRAQLLAARRARTPAALATARAAVCGHVLAAAASSGWTSVAAYEPMRTEPGSSELLRALRERGLRVIVPVTLPDRDLDWTDWETSEPLGLSAIASVDAVLVPALAVRPDGMRLGRGGGSYDRALARCRPGTTVVALLFDDEIVADVPRDTWDVPVAAAITPAGWHSFGNPGGGVVG